MTFLRMFQLSHYGVSLAGFLALALTGFLPLPALLAIALVVMVAEIPAVRRRVQALPTAAINGLSLLVFGYLFVASFVIRHDLVGAVIHFTIYLQVLKILTARRNRDFFQIYILALSHVVLATMLMVDASFLIPFLAFIVLAPWSLTMFSLKADLERAYLGGNAGGEDATHAGQRSVQEWLNARGVVTPRFFLATAALGLVLLLHTVLLFVMFPRVSLGFLFRNMQYAGDVTGFSEHVDLSSFGTIKESDAVVMRVFPSTGRPLSGENLYWRGLAFDVYEGNQWLRQIDTVRHAPMLRTSGMVRLRAANASRLVEQRVYLEPLDTDLLFAMERVDAVCWDAERIPRIYQRLDSDSHWGPSLALDSSGGIHFDGGLQYERVYTAYSTAPADGQISIAEERIDPLYRQLPRVSAQFRALADRLAASASNDEERVQAVMKHLAGSCSYTLDVPQYGGNAIEGFLFEGRRGHCEYFASAAALLLRAAGVPARVVSGFRGGDWNEYGKYITVRQRNAHTWIEAALPGRGWVRFDPTPPDETAGGFRSLRFKSWRHIYEWMELRWYNYVINFEYRDQQRIVVGIASGGRRLAHVFSGDWSLRGILEALRKPRGAALLGSTLVPAASLGLAVLAFALLRKKWRQAAGPARRRAGPGRPPRFYLRYLAICRDRGVVKIPCETARELSGRFALAHPELRPDSDFVVSSYYRCRFDDKTPTGMESTRIAEALRRMSRAARHRRRLTPAG